MPSFYLLAASVVVGSLILAMMNPRSGFAFLLVGSGVIYWGLLSVAYLQYIVPAAFFIALPGYVAFILWTVAVSRGLLRSAPRRSAIPAAQPA